MAAAFTLPSTLAGVRDYVLGSSNMQQTADSTIQLFITHNHLKAQFPEIRLDAHVSVWLAMLLNVK